MAENHPALLIMDVFKRQMNQNVLKFLRDNNIIPRINLLSPNLTYLF